MEQAAVVGVSSDKKITKITLLDVPDRPGLAAQVFQELASEDISVRLIIQSASSEGRGRITFVLDEEYADRVPRLIDHWKAEGVASEGTIEHNVAKISIVGSRLASTPGLAARMFFGARARGNQHRLHQLVRDEDRVRHCGRARRPRGSGRARRVLS